MPDGLPPTGLQPSEAEQAIRSALFKKDASGKLLPKRLDEVKAEDLLAMFMKLGIEDGNQATKALERLRNAIDALIRKRRASEVRPR